MVGIENPDAPTKTAQIIDADSLRSFQVIRCSVLNDYCCELGPIEMNSRVIWRASLRVIP